MVENFDFWLNAEEWQFRSELMDDNGELDVEKILLIRTESADKSISEVAAIRLFLAYVFGSFKLGDEQIGEKFVRLNGKYPDFEKIRSVAQKVIVDIGDFNSFMYASMEYDYDIVALEEALLAIDNIPAKTVLYFLYRDGFYNAIIHDRQVEIKASSLKTEERYSAFMEKNAEFVKAYALDEMK